MQVTLLTSEKRTAEEQVLEGDLFFCYIFLKDF